jgi:hypothetical protein
MNWPPPVFRITVPAGSEDDMTVRRAIRAPADSAIARISKLIPAEVVGAYLTGRAIALASEAIGSWAAVCLGLTLVLRAIMTRDENAPDPWATVQWDAVIYAAISFVTWTYAMGDHVAGLQLGKYQFWPSLLAIIWPVLAAQLVLLGRTRA